MPIGEKDFIERAKTGDDRAFGELVLMHQSFVFNLALRAVGDPHEAEDLAQDAFIRAWQALPRFRADAKFSTWLYRIVVNLCYNRRPKLKQEQEFLSMEENEEFIFQGDEINPIDEVDDKELRTCLHRKIDELPATQKMLIQLRYQQELSYEDISEVMQMPMGTVKTSLFRAHAHLRQEMARMEEMTWVK